MRTAANKSQIEVARMLAISQGAVSQWEQGLSFPSTEKLPIIAKLYNVTEGEIIAAITKAKEGV